MYGGFGAVPAQAHAVLEASDPAAGARIEHAPDRVTLSFDEPVETSLGSLRVIDAAGRERSSGPVMHPGGDATRVTVRTASLERGRYVVTWQVVSADSHVVGGAFAFGVGVSAGEAPPLERDIGATVLVAIVHFTLLVAVLVAIGVPLAALAGVGASSAGFAEFAAWFVVALAAFADVALRAAINGGTLFASFATHVGALRSWTIGLAFIAVLGLIGTRRRLTIVVPAGVASALSLSLAGHAAVGSSGFVGVAADALHLLAAAMWVGLLVNAVVERGAANVQRITPVAMVAVGTIVLTGTVATIRNVDSWRALFDTPYGYAIDLKVALLLGALAIAEGSRRMIARGAFAVRRRIALELTLIAAVAAVTAVLVDLPLPREEPARAAAAAAFRVRDVDVRVRATADDARHWRLSVTSSGPGGAARVLDGVEASVTETRRHVGPLPVALQRNADGSFAGEIALPFDGAWTAFVSARAGDFDENHITLQLGEDR